MLNASATAKIAMETIATSRIVAIERYLVGFELFKLGLLSLTEKITRRHGRIQAKLWLSPTTTSCGGSEYTSLLADRLGSWIDVNVKNNVSLADANDRHYPQDVTLSSGSSSLYFDQRTKSWVSLTG